jgi:hypothetical protein
MFPGFSFKETMSGSYWRLATPADERALSFTIVARASDIRRFAKDRIWSVEGTVDAEGLATHKEVHGTMAFRLLDQRRLPYRLTFTGDDGQLYELSGQKEWSGLAPIESMTLLPASLYGPDGEEMARATVRFDVRADLGRWMKSFRVHLFG